MKRSSGQVEPGKRLTEAQDRFIAAWGQMGSTWGISRTMAEVHALLYIAGEPLCTDDVMERLEISRGNASMSLRALVDWGIIARVHKRGDRKEYFAAEQDPWVIVRAVVAERMRREVHPVLAGLAEIRDSTRDVARGEGKGAAELAARVEAHHQRLDAMLAVLAGLSQLGEQFVALSAAEMREAATALTGGGSAGIAAHGGGGIDGLTSNGSNR
jgi:HTH-type transcriptional regulator, glycine betaine synthesis regulator